MKAKYKLGQFVQLNNCTNGIIDSITFFRDNVIWYKLESTEASFSDDEVKAVFRQVTPRKAKSGKDKPFKKSKNSTDKSASAHQ